MTHVPNKLWFFRLFFFLSVFFLRSLFFRWDLFCFFLDSNCDVIKMRQTFYCRVVKLNSVWMLVNVNFLPQTNKTNVVRFFFCCFFFMRFEVLVVSLNSVTFFPSRFLFFYIFFFLFPHFSFHFLSPCSDFFLFFCCPF